MSMIRAGAALAVAVGLCVAASLPALSQGFGLRIDGEHGNIEVTPPQDERRVEDQRRQDERGDAEGHHSRGFGFRFDGDERGNVEGKRASCEVYAKIAQVQADANRKFNCGYNGPRWDHGLEQHFRWCRHVRREAIVSEVRERAGELQRCFDRLGDFDDEAWERR